MQTNAISLNRVGRLIRNDFYNKRRSYLLILAVLIIGLSVFSFLSFDEVYYFVWQQSFAYNNANEILKIHFVSFPIALLTIGYIFTSLTIDEWAQYSSKQFYLSLPANTIEKWLSKWLLSAIVFPVGFLIFFQVFQLVVNNWAENMGFKMNYLSPFDSYALFWIGFYIITQSIFLLGAIVFPKFSFLLTSGILMFLLLGFNLVFQWTSGILIPELEPLNFKMPYFFSLQARLHKVDMDFSPEFLDYLKRNSLSEFIWVGSCIIFPLMLMISFFKLKEKEV